jgi:hypothetical protein
MDFIFDVHSMKEFNDKIEILFRRKLSQKTREKAEYGVQRREKYQNDVLDTYFEIIHLITDNIKHIDNKKYNEISNIWDGLLYGNNSFEDTVNYCKYFISYISSYILNTVMELCYLLFAFRELSFGAR